jgi:hypothetical protein
MYFMLPFNGAAIALIFYFIIRGGFMTTIDKENALVSIAVAALVGLYSEQAALKLRHIANAVLTKPGQGEDKKPQNSEPLEADESDTKPGAAAYKIQPDKGKAGGGEEVSIIGTGFSSVSKLTFGGINLHAVAIKPDVMTDTITVVTPPHAPGEVDVIVVGDKAPAARLKFTYE